MYRDRRFLAEEAFYLGLLRLDCDPALFDRVVSRRYQAQVQRKVNPVPWSPLLTDKGVFYRFCEANGIPAPELYAIYFQKTPGYCPTGMPLYDTEQWVSFISGHLPAEFVIKPCAGYGGDGVSGYRRVSPDEFVRSDLTRVTARQIVDLMRHDRGADSFVIQQRLYPHSGLSELSQSSSLQTVRMATFIGRDMHCRILFSYLKLTTRESMFIDNIQGGLTGNLINNICPETGVVTSSFAKTRDGRGDQPITRHPITHRELPGFTMPHWEQACGLVRRAAHAFLPVRSVGWDVAITDDGVRILEGNVWWDRLCHSDYIRTILDDVNGGSRESRRSENTAWK